MTNVRSALIVDADPLTLEALRVILNQSEPQWKILEARNAMEAKTAAERSRPHIILVKHKPPQLNGIQVMESILTSAADSRILFLSEDISMIHSAFGAGALGYLCTHQISVEVLPAIDQLLLGRTFFTAEAVRLLSLRYRRNPYPGEHKILTAKEMQILQEIALGTPNKEIARKLGISHRTVENHRANIMEKLQAENSSDLVRYAVRTGIVEA